eukprot:CAMPEP_0119052194 /NCGR_PEP_ID=MMETSP1177-20130426/73578_1 /TAXON_ID=2985 /ORGANISM="Ochromonas sp, Strain CCMP1899" /LENGTH=166 /DNA_ID=CAMNT_0007031685 /DNA_START=18 /DNA_END=518 /DNA_ORIENTATION=-
MKDWSKVDYNAMDKSWEGGDDERELDHDFEISRKEMDKRAKKAKPQTDDDIRKMMKNDPLGVNKGMGGSMMFCQLKPFEKKDVRWTKKTTDKLAGKWTSLLRSASYNVKVVDVGHDDQENTLLLSVDQGSLTYEVIKFALRQKETLKLTLNNRDYTKKDLPADDDE